ncbi:MAG: hypothetical protein CMO55_15785 [Verrucomicrobiales bacterium]|nr:hypothetical protein [Verrucomicrobiales bacterium]
MPTDSIQPKKRELGQCGLCFVAASVALMAIVVMIGWFVRSEAITQLSPSFVAMQFNTALMFLAASVATILAFKRKTTGALISTICLIAFSFLTGIQYLTNTNFGLDTLIVDPFTTEMTSHPGRMAPNTALAFILTGLGIMELLFRERWKIYPVVGSTLALCIAILSLYGYATLTENAYGWSDLTPIALHTAVGFAVLNLTILIETWRRSRAQGNKDIPEWIAFIVGSLALTVGVGAWNSLLIVEQRKGELALNQSAYSASQKIDIEMRGDVKAMRRMADRYELGMRGDWWIEDAENYLEDIPGLFAIAFYQTSPKAKRVIAVDDETKKELRTFSLENMAKATAEHQNLYLNPDWNKDAFMISFPIKELNETNRAGTLIGFFDSEQFFAHSIGNEENSIIVSMGDKTIYVSPTEQNSEGSAPIKSTTAVLSSPWTITARGNPEMTETGIGLQLSTITLISAFTFALLIYLGAKEGIRSYNLNHQRSDLELQEAYDELETLLYIISHDLKEPIRSVNSFTEILVEDYSECLPEDGRTIVAKISSGAGRMEDLLAGVAMISRAIKMDTPMTKLPLEKIVIAQITSLSEEERYKDAKVNVSHSLPSILVEEAWVSRAVNNLLSNALKFSDPSVSAEVEVEPYHGPEGKGIVVKDRGPGLPKHADNRLFDLFRRGVGKNVEGSGIGLAIVKKVAQRHGGKAWFKNRQGGGAEFYLTLEPSKRNRR